MEIEPEDYIDCLENSWNKLDELPKLKSAQIAHFNEPYKMFLYVYYGYFTKQCNYTNEQLSSHINEMGDNLLLLSIKCGSVQNVEYLIEERGFNINYYDYDCMSPLIFAIIWNKTEIVKYLISAGIDYLVKDLCGNSALILACEAGNIELVKYFVEELSFNLNYKSNYQISPLFMAIKNNKFNIVKLLISYECDINITGSFGNNMLYYIIYDLFTSQRAFKMGITNSPISKRTFDIKFKIFKYLINKGINIKTPAFPFDLYNMALKYKLYKFASYLKRFNFKKNKHIKLNRQNNNHKLLYIYVCAYI
jgi:hypothetical protein